MTTGQYKRRHSTRPSKAMKKRVKKARTEYRLLKRLQDQLDAVLIPHPQ